MSYHFFFDLIIYKMYDDNNKKKVVYIYYMHDIVVAVRHCAREQPFTRRSTVRHLIGFILNNKRNNERYQKRTRIRLEHSKRAFVVQR